MNIDKTLLAQILTRSYPITPYELIPLAERIREIEGLYVNLDFQAQPKSNSDYSPGRYDYERAASGKMNAQRWVEKRFEPRFPFLNASITTSQGRPLLAEELLSYAKAGPCGIRTGFALRFQIESNKETSEEQATELKKLKRLFASFPIIGSRELVDRPGRFLFFKWHTNELILDTKPLCLRGYELSAVEEILHELVTRMGCDVVNFDHESVKDGDILLENMFTSQDLNTMIPSKKETFTRKLLCLTD